MSNKRYAIITGGSRGIGKAICERFAKDGINIIFSYNLLKRYLQTLRKEILKAIRSLTVADIHRVG